MRKKFFFKLRVTKTYHNFTTAYYEITTETHINNLNQNQIPVQ